MGNLSGSIELTNLKHVEREMKGKDGKMVKVLIIPIEENHLIVGEPNEKGKQPKYLSLFCPEAKPEQKPDYWMIQGKKKEEDHEVPFLGSLKGFDGGGSSNSNGAVEESPEASMEDDLPF